ncbi:MAG: DUF2243 domain-containing protein [Pseudomonadota bacterium]
MGPLIASGTLIGIGMGGFVDGIIFHQIFQLHNMFSAKLPPDTLVNIEVNMFWDGIFHVFTWLMTAIGIFLLWQVGKKRNAPWSGRAFCGALVMGWSLFNLIEGIIDHHIINIHHVIERLGVSIYDYVFLASGVIFIFIGQILIRKASNHTSDKLSMH